MTVCLALGVSNIAEATDSNIESDRLCARLGVFCGLMVFTDR